MSVKSVVGKKGAVMNDSKAAEDLFPPMRGEALMFDTLEDAVAQAQADVAEVCIENYLSGKLGSKPLSRSTTTPA